MKEITVHFEGPFYFGEGANSIFHSKFAKSQGVYIWTFKQHDGSHLIHYIGETSSFAKRQREHLINVLGLNYGVFHPDDAKNGICNLVWPGLWRDKSADGPGRLLKQYTEYVPLAVRYIHEVTVFFATVNEDTLVRRHIEGSIGHNLRKRHPLEKRLFPDDNRIGISKTGQNVRLLISSTEPIRGLDPELEI